MSSVVKPTGAVLDIVQPSILTCRACCATHNEPEYLMAWNTSCKHQILEHGNIAVCCVYQGALLWSHEQNSCG